MKLRAGEIAGWEFRRRFCVCEEMQNLSRTLFAVGAGELDTWKPRMTNLECLLVEIIFRLLVNWSPHCPGYIEGSKQPGVGRVEPDLVYHVT